MQSLIIPYKTQHYCEDVEYKNKLSEPGVGFFFFHPHVLYGWVVFDKHYHIAIMCGRFQHIE